MSVPDKNPRRTMTEQNRELVAFGRHVRARREDRGMTPAELASAAGMKRDRLEALEAGRLAPTGDLLPALAAGLAIDAVLVSSGGYLDTAAVCAAFGRRLRTPRERRGVSQDALAGMTGVHRTSIHKFESGRSDPRLTSIRLLAHGLGVPPRELVEDGAA
ncbi:MAG: helix-turn-helix domain-containing protein [Solirubrobacteraceae bacterium]